MKTIKAVLDAKGNVLEPEHELHDNGVRVLDGIEYGRLKSQNRECPRVTSNTSGESLTKQSEATINGYHVNDMQAIASRCLAGQPVSQLQAGAQYIDTTVLPDYQTALDAVNMTNQLFMGLDPQTRQNFGNDPQNMLSFVADPKNAALAVKLGLLHPSALQNPAKQAEAKAEAEPTGSQGVGA